jgi:ATP-binding protein involved in chromosome partitioning
MSRPLKIPVLSLKGGTGKTTTCIDIARVLRDKGNSVGLLDVDIHASALPRALHLEKPPGYEAVLGGKLRPIAYDGFEIFSIGLLFPEDSPNMWPGDAKSSAVKQIATTSIAWNGSLDFVVVDTPPTSGDEVQSLLKNLTDILGAVVICQPNDLAVLALAKTLNVLRETETPIAGVIANMAGYQCPKCGFISNPFDRPPDDVKEMAEKLGVPFLGAVPFAAPAVRRPVVEAIVNGILENPPVVLKDKKGGLTRWALDKLLR